MKECENKQYIKRKIIATFGIVIKDINDKNRTAIEQEPIFICNKSCNYGYQIPVKVGKTDYATCITEGNIDERSMYQICRNKLR